MNDTAGSGHSSRRRRRSNTGGTAYGRGRDEQSDYRPTQLQFDAAFRAREVAAPSPEDLAEAAENLTVVRRNYVPGTPT